MTTESPPTNNNDPEVNCWPTHLEDTIDISPKHSKLISSLKKSIENGEEALEHDNLQMARLCFESAEKAAEQLEQREWNNTEAKNRLQTETIPAIKEVLSQLESDTESERRTVFCD